MANQFFMIMAAVLVGCAITLIGIKIGASLGRRS